MAARQFIYHMQGLGKTWPGGKKVLENINRSFYPERLDQDRGAGVNGSGKSTLLRIMAGLDTEFVGEGFVAEDARVGFCRRSLSSTQRSTSAATPCSGSRTSRRSSTATTNWR